MAQPQFILDFNRYIAPNPFNTGPAIPNPPPLFSLDEIHSPLPQFGSFHLSPSNLDVPDLSTSPASTISSTSLKLEDEEIKRIFSHPRYAPSHDASYDQQRYISCYQDSYSYSPDSTKKEDLNPHAAPFVPSFILSGSPRECITIARPHSSLLSQQSLPHHPPELPIPTLTFSPPPVSETPASDPLPQPDPQYLPILLDSLKPSTTPREREVLVKFIITGTTFWDIENLLDLAERLCVAACNTGPDFDKHGQALTLCDPSRYHPVGEILDESDFLKVEESQMPEDVAAVAAELHRQFLNLQGEEAAQAFAWNVREVVLMQFIHSWDCVKPGSISYKTSPSSRFVRSSLLLCKTIAALFKQNLIGREHISMCISVLLKDMMSVEHTEAVYNILLGCGQSFWVPSNPSEDIHPTLHLDGVVQLNCHVHDFITGLHANFLNNNLTDEMSVVGQPWGKGQLLARLAEIVDCVREWESLLISELRL